MPDIAPWTKGTEDNSFEAQNKRQLVCCSHVDNEERVRERERGRGSLLAELITLQLVVH